MLAINWWLCAHFRWDYLPSFTLPHNHIEQEIVIRSDLKLRVFTPFNDEETAITYKEGKYKIILPNETFYAIIQLTD